MTVLSTLQTLKQDPATGLIQYVIASLIPGREENHQLKLFKDLQIYLGMLNGNEGISQTEC